MTSRPFASLLIALAVATTPVMAAAIPTAERDALIALYDSTNGPGWARSENWKGAPGTECTWRGITCDSGQTTVVSIDLSYNGLNGPIPSQLSALTNLQFLSFRANSMTGTLPSSLGQLTNLTYFACDHFYYGQVTGPIPSSFANLTKLETLDLGGERLDGSVPAFLATFPNLQTLYLGGNRFSGTIPPALFTKPSLVRLDFSGSDFSGPLPTVLNLPNLEELNLGECRLSGPIPAGLSKSPKLRILSLIFNKFTGSIPTELGSLPLLEELILYGNELDGTIPPVIGNDLALKRLLLGRNRITGPIPSTIGQLKNLVTLNVYSTGLGGPIPAELFTLTRLENLSLDDYQYADVHTSFSGSLAEFGKLTALKTLSLDGNNFPGPIPVALTQLPNLIELHLNRLPLGGTIPPDIRNLKKLEVLELSDSKLTGALPSEISELTGLYRLVYDTNAIAGVPASFYTMTQLKTWIASSNKINGPISPRIGQLINLEVLRLDDNQLSSSIPAELFQLPRVQDLSVSGNQLEGQIPPLSGLPKIQHLGLNRNRLTGPIPSDVGTPALDYIDLSDNELTGQLPDLRNLKSLRTFLVSRNHLSGSIPSTLGNVTTLAYLYLDANKFTGDIPASLTNLTALLDFGVALGFNALTASDPTLRAFLAKKAGDWESSQTVAPTNVSVSALKANSVVVSWQPIFFTGYAGGYVISTATNAGGPFTPIVTTPDKYTTTFTLDGLTPSTDYFIQVSTLTFPHSANPNVVTSLPSPAVQARTTNGAPVPAAVIVLAYPYSMYQNAGQGGGSDTYVLANVGGMPTTITLGQEQNFFTQSPAIFDLPAGGVQTVRVTGLPQAAGSYIGASVPTGAGVPAGLKIPIRLLSAVVPTGTVNAVPSQNRIDVSATIDQSSPTGTVSFTNTGTSTLSGIVVSDVPWIIPPSNVITIAPGQTVQVTFTINRMLRPDASSLSGTVVGTLSLVYPKATSTARSLFDGPTTPQTGTTLVTVVDTIKPPVTAVGFPPLRAGEVPLFLPGVGHVRGSVGLFISDLSIINAFGVKPADDVKIFFTSLDGTNGVTTSGSLAPTQSLNLADVISSVYNSTADQGTLQIRSLDWSKLSLNSNIFVVNRPEGTFGSSIPTFRGDRALAPGKSLILTGVRGHIDTVTHTNIFVQETSGNPAKYDLDFLDAQGNIVPSSITGEVSPFRLSRQIDKVPPGAVAARLTNRTDSGGQIVGYATPVDDKSGDIWTVVDWNSQFASDGSIPQIVPAALSAPGANNTFFRTDLAITNVGTDATNGVLRFYYESTSAEQRLSLNKGETRVYNDIIGTLFPSLAEKVGYMIFTPDKGNVVITSRTFATQEGLPGTFGTGVPTIPISSALYVGQSRLISGLEAASKRTIGGHTPATFRTNLGMMEVSGSPAEVKVTIIYADAKQASLAAGSRLISKTYNLRPHQFIQENITNILSVTNPNVGDLRNVQVEFRVTSGDGAVIVYSSSVDNGTADQILRTE